MQDPNEFFAEVRQLTDRSLGRLIPDGQKPQRLFDAVRWSIFGGGKRFRPSLVIASGRTFGASDDKLLCTAAAFEMVHTYSLIHDDLPAMDNDVIRRGRETCHVKFDEATAILAGDVLQSLAIFAVATDAELTTDKRIAVLQQLSEAADIMVRGQQMDLEAEGKAVDLEEIDSIHRCKTGAIITAAVRSGAVIGDADDHELSALSNYAEKLGLLFQVTDDLIDLTQTTEVLGKTAGKDTAADKATYPKYHGLERTVELAKALHAEAIGYVSGLDRRVDLLCGIADFVLERKS